MSNKSAAKPKFDYTNKVKLEKSVVTLKEWNLDGKGIKLPKKSEKEKMVAMQLKLFLANNKDKEKIKNLLSTDESTTF